MSLTTALRAPVAILYRHAGSVLPYYLLAAGAPAVARTWTFIGLGLTVAYLAATGRIEPVFDAIDGIDLGAVPAESEPSGGPLASEPEPGASEPLAGADPAAVGALVEALQGLVTPVSVTLVLGGFLLAVVAGVVARGVAAAATLGSLDAALHGEDPSPAGIAAVADHWRAFVLLRVLNVGLFVAAVGIVVAGFVLAGVLAAGTPSLDAVSSPAALAAGSLGAVAGAAVALPLFVAGSLVLGFAGPAVAVDDRGAIAAVRRAVALVPRRPAAYAALFGVYATVVVAGGVGSLVASLVSVPRLIGVLTALLVFPLLDGFRLALYADRGVPDAPGSVPDEPAHRRALATVRDGLTGLAGFAVGHPIAVAGGGGFLAAGFAGGWLLVPPDLPVISPPGASPAAGQSNGAFSLVQIFVSAPGTFVNIAANNWLVAVGATYGGVVFGLPAAVTMVSNGALIGLLAAVFDPFAFVVLVAPHGIIELPALILAAGVGLHLGRCGLDVALRKRELASLEGEFSEAFKLLVGIAVLLVVASAIEAVVTPLLGWAIL